MPADVSQISRPRDEPGAGMRLRPVPSRATAWAAVSDTNPEVRIEVTPDPTDVESAEIAAGVMAISAVLEMLMPTDWPGGALTEK